MNLQKDKKISLLRRVKSELEGHLPEIENYNPEVGADLRWSIISIIRAIRGLGGRE